MVRAIIALGFILWSVGYCAPRPVALLEVFQDAMEHDPIYQQQVATFEATKQSVPENFAALLPQVTVSGALAQEFHSVSPTNDLFSTNSLVLTGQQTIFNYTQFKQLDQARLTVRSAFATLTAQQQDLMVRTTKAFLDVLQAQELVNFARQQKQYINSQLQATETLFNHREATITDLEQAKGAAELIYSDLYTAEIKLFDAIQSLSQITGYRYQTFATLNDKFPLHTPKPNDIDAWTTTANRNNWLLRSARLTVQASREAIEAVKGNFYPNFSGVLELDNGAVPDQLLTDTFQKNDYSYGINMSWNAFQGGLTLAQVKAAKANLCQSEAALSQQYLQTMANTRRAFNAILSGVPRVRSLRAALTSNTQALQHAQESYRAGETSITEILQIQYQLYNAQSAYAEYIYNYLYNMVLLKQSQGTLCVTDLARINSYLLPKITRRIAMQTPAIKKLV